LTVRWNISKSEEKEKLRVTLDEILNYASGIVFTAIVPQTLCIHLIDQRPSYVLEQPTHKSHWQVCPCLLWWHKVIPKHQGTLSRYDIYLCGWDIHAPFAHIDLPKKVQRYDDRGGQVHGEKVLSEDVSIWFWTKRLEHKLVGGEMME
jgi:hypothetical protein